MYITCTFKHAFDEDIFIGEDKPLSVTFLNIKRYWHNRVMFFIHTYELFRLTYYNLHTSFLY